LGVARFRNRAEARHLARVFDVRAGQSALDLGGGTGRWAVFFAERGAQVTMVELAASLTQGARRNAEQRGLAIDCRVGSILQPPLMAAERFDIVHIGNVLVYVNDGDLARVRAVVRAHARDGARLVVREPVDPHGPSEQHSGPDYRALFRRPETYVDLFAPDWRLIYQRTTVSHWVPRGRDTHAVVASLKSSKLRRQLVDRVLPWLGYVDYGLLGLEERVRGSRLAPMLGDPGVVQRFYIFERR
ncbi:MAG TPA: methyltransferase domain-containing protein, partial [Polyangiales bacterium]|nr:methyltransferase domain-containing protein [Polyangiales bacterium]